MSEHTSSAKQFEYKAEMKQLLDLIVHSLYTHPEIFLRELISNASDALGKARFRMLSSDEGIDKSGDLKITITVDKESGNFVIEDTGIGMSEEELIANLGTVAKSGTLGFMESLKAQQKEGQPLDANLIGQFGVGFYSVFMVTDEVTVETKSAEAGSQGWRWVSSGQGTYTIEPIEREARGTKISFTLKEEFKEFAEEYRVEQIIKKYSNFVEYPIMLGSRQINSMTALWQRPKSELKEEEVNEFYKFISNDYKEPLDYLHVSVEGVVSFKALLFIPSEAPMELLYQQGALEKRGPQLYVKKVLIQHECRDLLPEYLRFVSGVVDTEDLSLNVSRELVQSSPVMAKIRQILTSKLLGWFDTLAKEQPEKFRTFYKAFGTILKIGLNTDFTNRDKLIELLRFETTKTGEGEYVTLKQYVGRMAEGQEEIYYHSGNSRAQMLAHPNLEYFRKKDIEVLLLSDPVDVFVIPSLFEYEKKPLKSIEKAEIDASTIEPEAEKLGAEGTVGVISLFKEVLGERVADVVESKRLVSSPVTLVSAKDAMDSQMEKVMKMMQQDADMPGAKKVLEVNTAHPIIRNLAGKQAVGMSSDPIVRAAVMQLFDSAMLLEGDLESVSDYVSRMNELVEAATRA
ncbi:heat shock protein Hsp90 [Chlorobaculum parvum NCIB 8327]|uniref:Chaperone protein HtpG n=1 Tax=Chlorobaculum parvum (strain DSM 263 / NCIMB 8327) TaxID=517417 RepID=B3QMW5_CHLP8|nr:molecular chaperone HtpG [Chlorobaculum parvum]ACF11268.1 heat shock protein Hsp90 [Chlorobaculum parvum NCIB 8327]